MCLKKLKPEEDSLSLKTRMVYNDKGIKVEEFDEEKI